MTNGLFGAALGISICVISLFLSSQTPSPVISAFYAIKWFHDIIGLKYSTELLDIRVLQFGRIFKSNYIMFQYLLKIVKQINIGTGLGP